MWGATGLSHNASIAVVRDGQILFAGESERYSRIKNDRELSPALVEEARAFGDPDVVVWYERPLLKKTRQLRAGQWWDALDPWSMPATAVRRLLPGVPYDLHYGSHHKSHAAGGYLTSGFSSCAVVTLDAIGEWDCMTVGILDKGTFSIIRRAVYPHSIGLLFSAFTQRCGFKPNEEEFIVMGLASYGEPKHVGAIEEDFLEHGGGTYRLRRNVHCGIGDWLPGARVEDLAASIQAVVESVVVDIASWARRATDQSSLVLMGGLALNCVANTRVALESGFESIFILPSPGDAGSAIGAAAAYVDRPLEWRGPFLGSKIDRTVSVRSVLDALESGRLVGIANGRAEFGPRALGNRSLLGDPRGQQVKEQVNLVKGREQFRPFAPAMVSAERAADYFDMPVPQSPYMQYVARCIRPAEVPAVVHVDGTSRVQTVGAEDNPLLRELLLGFEQRTGCPVLLNTSLNVRGEPLVNTWTDAQRFAHATGVEVF